VANAAPPAIDLTTSSLTKIPQPRSCAPMLAIISSADPPCFAASLSALPQCGFGFFF
jgi:hypothetical protein